MVSVTPDLADVAAAAGGSAAADRDALDLLCFRNLMAASTDIIHVKDVNSRYRRMSRGDALCYGLDDPRALEGRSDADFYDPGHAAET